ncbi:MAG: hypothetical protein Kow0069_31690 [Promethearchaeota archaeon]
MSSSCKDKVTRWLRKFGIPDERIRIATPDKISSAPENIRGLLEHLIVVPYKVTFQSGREITLEASLVCGDKWIQVKLLLMRGSEVPANLREKLYALLLQANFNLNEVTYSLSENGDVYVETDMPSDTEYDNFQVEYGSVEFGAEYFLSQIIPALQQELQVKPTYEA